MDVPQQRADVAASDLVLRRSGWGGHEGQQSAISAVGRDAEVSFRRATSAERIDRGDRNPEEDTYRVEVSIKVVGGSNRYGYMAGWTIVAGYFDASGQIVKVPQDSDQTHVDAPLYETTEKTTIVVPHQIERRLRGRLINPSFRIESITCQ